MIISLSVEAQGKKARVVRLADVKKVIEAPGDEIRVVNFWATWCAPCVKELHLFDQLGRDRKDVKVTLVSLDLDLDPNPQKVHRFVQRRKIESPVLILDESDPNSWIEKIEREWSGAVPATIVVNSKTGERRFVGRELQAGELEKLVEEVQ